MSQRSLPSFAVHVTTGNAWEQVRDHGLRTAQDLIAHASDVSADRRRTLLARREAPCNITVGGQTVVLNHNKPIKPALLERCLANATLRGCTETSIADFYAALNKRVFFWPGSSKHMATFAAEVRRNGRALQRSGSIDRIWVDLHELRNRMKARLGVAQYNSGSTPQFGGQIDTNLLFRSKDMWVSPEFWSHQSWPIKEIAVKESISSDDLWSVLVRVERSDPSGRTKVVWSR